MAKLHANSSSPGHHAHWRIVLAWAVPVAFLLWLWFDGLQTWFVADDFAWLSLLRNVHSFRDVVHALFAPAAQGTIRPWSERGFFLLFESLFGIDSLPFRICVFLTIAADLALIVWITRRITGSLVAGSAAAILWTANGALATVAAWSSAWNEVLCPLFLLAATALFIRYAETGHRAYWWWQAAVFTLGFGALEVNVVYPALAAAWVLFVAAPEKRRKLLVSLVSLFSISVVYYLIHRALAPLPKDGPYAVIVDSRIFHTLATYWQGSLRPWSDTARLSRDMFWMFAIALAAFSIRQLAKRRYSAGFFGAWFLITLAPVLPLPHHIVDYYLTIPLIGLAMLAGSAVAETFRRPWIWRLAAAALVAAYLGEMIHADRIAARWWLDRSQAVRGLVLGAAAAQKTHPGKTIVLDGITEDIYGAAIGDSAFSSVGLDEVYLTPESANRIHPGNNSAKLDHITLEPGVLRHAITHNEAVIYVDAGDHLRNVTGAWETSASRLPDEPPRHVEAANPLDAYLLGPEWLPPEPGFRWMPGRATVYLAGPKSVKDELVLEGYCPDSQLRAGPLGLSVAIDGIPLAPAKIVGPAGDFRRVFSIPRPLIGKERVEVAISVDRVFRDQGGRELGLVFGMIAIQ